MARRLPPYGWPLKPFNRQHPIRAYLNDPRIGERQGAFHFGVDISAPDGTAVYAVEGGTVHLEGPQNVGVVSTGGARSFGYWHLVPKVIHLQAVKPRQLLGHVAKGWLHVHFAERHARDYVNPLRPGALSPFSDPSSPRIQRIAVERRGADLAPDRLTGAVDLVVEAYDQPALPVATPWDHMPVAPALIRWRLVRFGKFPVPWTTSVDFRTRMLPAERFDEVYAPGTRQNRPARPGLYRFYLARGWDSRRFENGEYRLDVEARDLYGNRALAHLVLILRNR